jgi:uncharacterized damage-inducible protein DinB
MKAYFLKQIAYERWANEQILTALSQLYVPDDRALLLFSHLLSSSSMWLSRIHATPFTTTLFQERTLAECEQLMIENTNAWNAFIDTASPQELERVISYVFPVDGSNKKMSISDAITHLINHSSYHRGQIIARIKGNVPQLPLTTYILFASENE